jgi:urease subunit gamma/beta
MEGHSPYLVEPGDIELNAGRRTVAMLVANTGDRPIQIGSHAHFFEVNRALRFDRAAAFGMRLDIPAGTATSFEPGQEHTVTLVEFAGAREAHGMSALVEGDVTDDVVRTAAFARAVQQGFMTEEESTR